MKFTKDQRIDIGRQVYTQELSHDEAIARYGVVDSCIDNYVRMYKKKNGIPTRKHFVKEPSQAPVSLVKHSITPDIETYRAMSKDELINELIRSKANELRAKKGYEVKGAGVNKEFISLNNKNTKL